MTSPPSAPDPPVRAVTARAPGKIILLGEYAVMYGAPAVVFAVDRYAAATVRATAPAPPVGGSGWDALVRAPQLGIDGARLHRDAAGRVRFEDAADARRLRLVTTVIETVCGTDAAPAPVDEWEIDLDTGGFVGADGGKLGLGSSAALMVAAAAALAAAFARPRPSLAELVAAHRRFQGGRGSGFDIAAAHTGGALIYRDADDGPHATPIATPPDLTWCAVYTGRSGATAPLLARVAAWREGRPAEAARLFARISTSARQGAKAARHGATTQLIEVARDYRELLAELGERSGADIVGADHRDLANLAADCGVFYKGCGAGGGDTGIALATDTDAMSDFRYQVAARGYLLPDLAVASEGLSLTPATPDPARAGVAGAGRMTS